MDFRGVDTETAKDTGRDEETMGLTRDGCGERAIGTSTDLTGSRILARSARLSTRTGLAAQPAVVAPTAWGHSADLLKARKRRGRLDKTAPHRYLRHHTLHRCTQEGTNRIQRYTDVIATWLPHQ